MLLLRTGTLSTLSKWTDPGLDHLSSFLSEHLSQDYNVPDHKLHGAESIFLCSPFHLEQCQAPREPQASVEGRDSKPLSASIHSIASLLRLFMKSEGNSTNKQKRHEYPSDLGQAIWPAGTLVFSFANRACSSSCTPHRAKGP